MCLFTTTPTRTNRGSVVDPPRHSSRYSAHPPPGVVRIPRDRRSSFRRSEERYIDYDDGYVVEPRRSSRVVGYAEEPRRSGRAIEYVGEGARRSSRSVVRERDVDYRGSRGSFGVVEGRRSVSRVRI